MKEGQLMNTIVIFSGISDGVDGRQTSFDKFFFFIAHAPTYLESKSSSLIVSCISLPLASLSFTEAWV